MISIISPTVCRLSFDDPVKEKIARLNLTYVDKRVDREIVRLKNQAARYVSEAGRVEYVRLMEELKTRRRPCLLFKDESGFWTHSGLAFRLARLLGDEVKFGSFREPTASFFRATLRSLWPHQRAALERLQAAGHGAVSLPTGSGKSLVLEHLAAFHGAKTAIMAPSLSIAGQLLADFERDFGRHAVGQYFEGKKRADRPIVVGTSASFRLVKPGTRDWELLQDVDVLLGDECFPYDASIFTDRGPRPIGAVVADVERGRKVEVVSFQETEDRFVMKRVMKGFRRPMKDLLKVSFPGSSISATPNHPFLTTEGWKRADELIKGSVVLGFSDHGSGKATGSFRMTDDQIQILLGSYLGDGSVDVYEKRNKSRLRVIHGAKQEAYLRWKAGMFSAPVEFIPVNGYAKTPAYRFTTKCFVPKHKFSCPKKIDQDLVDALDWRGVAVWFMDDGSVEPSAATIHTNSFSEEETDLLVAKLRSMGADCHRSVARKSDGRSFPEITISASGLRFMAKQMAPYVHESMAYKLGGMERAGGHEWSTWSGESKEFPVVSVSPKKAAENVRGRTSANFLYDIEVEETHNFVVANSRDPACRAGVIAHNCHTLAADTLADVCLGLFAPAPNRYFLSATVTRTDGLDLLLEGVTGPVVYRKLLVELVDAGFLARPKVTMVRCLSGDRYDNPKNADKMVQKHLYENKAVYQAAGQIVNEMVLDRRRPTLVLVEEVGQFARLLPFLKVRSRFAHGPLNKTNAEDVPEDQRKLDPTDLVKEFNRGEFPVLVGTSCIGMGTDLTAPSAIVYLMGGTSEIKVMQALGRGTRGGHGRDVENPITGEKKLDCLVFDFDVANIAITHRHAGVRFDLYQEHLGVAPSWV